MKKALIIFSLLLIAGNGWAEDTAPTKPPVVLGLPLGEERSKVEALFQSANIPQLHRNDDTTVYKEPPAKIQNAGMTATFFQDGLLAKVVMVVEIDSQNAEPYIYRYKELKKSLAEKYGKPKASYEQIDDGYETHLLLALKTGKARYASFWETPTTRIAVLLRGDNFTIDFKLQYEHSVLADKFHEKQKTKEKDAL